MRKVGVEGMWHSFIVVLVMYTFVGGVADFCAYVPKENRHRMRQFVTVALVCQIGQ